MRRILILIVTILLSLAPARWGTAEVTDVSASRFAQATGPRAWSFPRDHGAHTDYQTEWWYLTGNLRNVSDTKREFGFQFTIFRRALTPSWPPRDSAWATRDVLLLHAALTHFPTGEFYHHELARRPVAGLAGYQTEGLDVRVENWQLRDKRTHWVVAGGTSEFGYQLKFVKAKEPVLNGPGGRDAKGAAANEASYYYSIPRMKVTGEIYANGTTETVEGQAWFDHEFGSNQMGAEVRGWDWLSLQFDDNTELMIYQLRDHNGRATKASGGTYVDAQGVARWLEAGDIELTPAKIWASPKTSGKYPVAWRVSVPTLGISGEVTTRMDDQEVASKATVATNYWEGSVRANFLRQGLPLKGVGYLEMTGYSGSLSGRF